MTAEELMKPRFEIIADYPDNYHGKVGTILDRDWSRYPNDDETQEPVWRISDFPHLFKKLNWWEHRTIDQMPKRVVSMADDNGNTYDIEEWDMDILVGWVNKESRKCCSLTAFNPEYGYFPID
jgi:hypothetical protein